MARPKKVEKVVDTPVESVDTTVVEEVAVVETKAKAVRGKKAAKVVEEEVVAEDAEEVKPKRGRKAKVVEEVATEEVVAEVAEVKPKKVTKKAAAVEVVSEVVAPVEEVVSEVKPKKVTKKAAAAAAPVVEEAPVVAEVTAPVVAEVKAKKTATKKATKAVTEEVTPIEVVAEATETKATKKASKKVEVVAEEVKEDTTSVTEEVKADVEGTHKTGAEATEKKEKKEKRAKKTTTDAESTETSAIPAGVSGRSKKNPLVWLELKAGPHMLGRIIIELFNDCPLAMENFRALCTGEIKDRHTGEPLTLKGTRFGVLTSTYVTGGLDSHREILSIYDGYFPDEKVGLNRKHDELGMVSLFSAKNNENDSKFTITLQQHMKHLDGQYVVFGKVIEGLRAVYTMALYGDGQGEPEGDCYISDCGRYKKKTKEEEEEEEEVNAEEEAKKAEEVKENPNTLNKGNEKPKCPTCDSISRYVSRDLKKHRTKWYCVNEECKHTFYKEETKLTTEDAMKMYADKKQANIKSYSRLISRPRNLRQPLKPARDVSGPHLMELVKAELKNVLGDKKAKQAKHELATADYKRYDTEMKRKREEEEGSQEGYHKAPRYNDSSNSNDRREGNRFGDRREDRGDRKFGDRRESNGDRREDRGDRKFGDRRESNGDRREDRGDRKFGDRRESNGDRREDRGDRKFGDRRESNGDRREGNRFGDRREDRGDRREGNDRLNKYGKPDYKDKARGPSKMAPSNPNKRPREDPRSNNKHEKHDGKPQKDKSRYRDRDSVPDEWIERQAKQAQWSEVEKAKQATRDKAPVENKVKVADPNVADKIKSLLNNDWRKALAKK